MLLKWMIYLLRPTGPPCFVKDESNLAHLGLTREAFEAMKFEDRVAAAKWADRHLQGQRWRVVPVYCDHSVMRERAGDAEHAWECADCGYVYGVSPSRLGIQVTVGDPYGWVLGIHHPEYGGDSKDLVVTQYPERAKVFASDAEAYAWAREYMPVWTGFKVAPLPDVNLPEVRER